MYKQIRYAEAGWNHEESHNLFVPMRDEKVFLLLEIRRIVSCLSKQNWKNQ